ncbi:MAG: AAA family ATPase [bacterium]
MAKYPNCPKSYEVFKQFMERCLVEDNSLIWPDMEVWNLENLEMIKTNFIDNPLEGGHFWDKVFEQFSNLNEGCWRILADALLVYTLPSSYMKPERKYGYIKKVCDRKNIALPDMSDEIWNVLNQGFTKTTLQYHQKYKQLWVIFLFSIRVKKRDNRKSFIQNHRAVREELYDVVESMEKKVDRSYGMLNAILHLGYPDYYDRMISLRDKKKVVDYYSNLLSDNLKKEGNLDDKILEIRKSFEEKEYNNEDKDFDFYLPEIISKWREGYKTDVGETVEEDPLLDDLVKSLRSHKQIILYGPPGTGKTYYAQRLAREVIAQDNFEKDFSELTEEERKHLEIGPVVSNVKGVKEDNSIYKTSKKNSYIRFCTFHPAYGYEDFIEGYRPLVSEEGRPIFKLNDGVFKTMCIDAINNPDKTFILIIDEINRGDIPRIFGELITLIEPEKRWKLEKECPETAVVLPASGEIFAVPENVIIIGTMNTADQSIALLDIALRRRFGFRELMPMTELLENQEISGINLGKWLKELNERVLESVGRNLQIGHSYMMKNGKPIKDEEDLIATIKDEILPLLQEYCYDDYFTLKVILGPVLVDESKGGFNQKVFTSRGKDLLLKCMKDMITGDENVE